MAVYIVTYDLNREVVRPNILAEIKQKTWAKLSESSYAIDTTETAQDVFNRLRPLIDDDDNLFVIPLRKPYAGYGPEAVIQWLDQRLTY